MFKDNLQMKHLIAGFVILIGIIFLNGCSTTHKKDGPPPFEVDETKVPNAVPKDEPLSKYGNMASYNVFGKRYYVMRTAKNYEERGIASWYGTKFHARHTSSGERYDMLAMTAAHKTLPLPTYVEVTNMKNGRTVIVKVNDRGPFESNRIIDLSYVAAKKLGMLGHGTTIVNVKAITPRDYYDQQRYASNKPQQPYYSSTPLSFPKEQLDRATGEYIQIGAFRNHASAEKLRKRVSAQLATSVRIDRAKSLYLVQVGPLNNNAAVKRFSKRLKTLGLSTKHITQKPTSVAKKVKSNSEEFELT